MKAEGNFEPVMRIKMVKNNLLLKSLLMKVIKVVYMETKFCFSHSLPSVIPRSTPQMYTHIFVL